MKIKHSRVWLAILIGNIILFSYYSGGNFDRIIMARTAGTMITDFPIIVVGAYIGGFIRYKLIGTYLEKRKAKKSK